MNHTAHRKRDANPEGVTEKNLKNKEVRMKRKTRKQINN